MNRLNIVIAMSIASAGALPATAATVTLDITQLPSATGWTYLAQNANALVAENINFSSSGFSIDQDTRGGPTDANGGAFYSRNVALSTNGNFSLKVDAVVRQFEGIVIGGGTTYPYGMFFGLAGTYFGIAGERLGSYSAGEGVKYYDLPTGFSVFDRHIYTLKSSNGIVSLLADGTILFNGALTGSTTGSDDLQFGDGTGFANAAGRYFSLEFSSGAVPEPASWAMLITGFGLTGATMRRRRSDGRRIVYA